MADCTGLKTVCQFVKETIFELTENEGLTGLEQDLHFIVIGPEAGYHLRAVEKCLNAELDGDRFALETTKPRDSLEIKDGYRILNSGFNANIGWRIVLTCDPIREMPKIIAKAVASGTSLEDLLPPEYVAKHRNALAAKPESEKEESLDESPKRIRIKLTNFYGAKGLTALHTIVIGLNNRVFPKDPAVLCDDEACKFIVALTRARRSVSLVTNNQFIKAENRSVHDPSEYLKLVPDDLKTQRRYGLKNGRLVQR